jgi:hypothetical protein
VTAISTAIGNTSQAAPEAPSQGARETVSPRVRTSGPGRPPLIDTPISVTQLARWLALPENARWTTTSHQAYG